MTIRELAPHISCVCTEESMEEALSKYSEVYIITVGGIFKHMKLRYDGRFIRAKVDSVPGMTSDLQEDLSFLPGGEKIPYHLFKLIVAFFRKVIEVKNSEVEAHVHILWNPKLGYYLAVPNQRVSKASVSYDYEHIGVDDIIIADFHSHNTMGAFFSGTDNNDDKNKTYYTGVVGDMKGSGYSVKLRFNFNEAKRECQLSEIFEIPEEEKLEVPKEWLDRIQTGYAYQGFQSDNVNGGQANRNFPGMGFGDDDPLYYPSGGGYHGMLGKPVGNTGTVSKKADASVGNKRRTSKGSRGTGAETTGVGMNQETGCIEFPPLSLAAAANEDENGINLGATDYDPDYINYLTIQYGEVVANGFDQALAGLTGLEEVDDLLEDIYREAADRLSSSTKARHGMPTIISPTSNRVKGIDNSEFRATFSKFYGEEITADFEQVVESLEDVDKCDEVLLQIVKSAVNRMSLQSQMALGVISTEP